MESQYISIKDFYFSFKGRISLGTFWLHGVLILPGLFFLISILYLGLWYLIFKEFSESIILLQIIISLPIFIVFGLASLALIVKRCHDRNRSGWFILITLIPIVGPFWYLAEIYLSSGTKGENRYGKVTLQLDEKIFTRRSLKWLELKPTESSRKDNLFRIFNIISLIISISICTICITYFQKEFSYDRFHENYDHIYRLGVNAQFKEHFTFAQTPYPMAEALVAEFPQITKATRITRAWMKVAPLSEQKQFNEEQIYFVDSDFIEVFSLQFIKGNEKTALIDTNSVVITKEMAVKYFGDHDPLGKLLVFDNRKEYIITGVVEKFPQNSHFHFDFLVSQNPDTNLVTNWNNFSYYTYILLKENTSPSQVEIGFPDFTEKYMSTYLQLGGSISFYLQSITDIHFNSKTSTELETNGNSTNVKIILAAGLLLLLFAGLNFVSLVSTRIIENSDNSFDNEIIKSTRKQRYKKLINETFIVSVIGFLGSIGLTRILLQFTSTILSNGLESSMGQTVFLSCMVWIILFVIMCCAGYLFLTAFSYHLGNLLIKGGLTILQVSFVLLMLTCTLLIFHQLHYMQKKDLGFDLKGLMIIDLHGLEIETDSLKTKLLDNPDIINVTTISGLIPPAYSTNFHIEGMPFENSFLMQTLGGEYDLLNILDIDLVTGRNFSESVPTDGVIETIINETAARRIGLEPVVGRLLRMYTDQLGDYQIIGIMKDVHFGSLHVNIDPLAIFINKSETNYFLLVKVKNNKFLSVISFIEETYKRFDISSPPNFLLLEDRYKKMNQQEERLVKILTFATIIELVICCFSIYSILAYLIYFRRRKKILSPYLLHIIITPALIYYSSVFSLTVAYILLDKWLHSFAYRVELTEVPFILAILIFLGISVLVTYLTFVYNKFSQRKT